ESLRWSIPQDAQRVSDGSRPQHSPSAAAMRLRCLGAAREVTGSMHLLELRAGSLLIDCGFFQGRREESRRRNAALPPEARAADAVLLTHAHIDHSGSLPTL